MFAARSKEGSVEPKCIKILDISEGLASGAATLMDVRYGSDHDWKLVASFTHADEAVSAIVDRPVALE
jgi:hypothetical protein